MPRARPRSRPSGQATRRGVTRRPEWRHERPRGRGSASSSSPRARRCRCSGSGRGRPGAGAPRGGPHWLEIGYRVSTRRRCTETSEILGVPRGERRAMGGVFVTTKLPQSTPRVNGQRLRRASRLSGRFVVLWLIHWPPGGRARPDVWERSWNCRPTGRTRRRGEQLQPPTDRRARAGDGAAPGRQPDRVEPGAVRPGRPRGHRRRGVRLEGYSPLRTMNLRDPRLVQSRRSTASLRRRSCSAGTSSTRSSRSRSRRTPSASPRTPRSSTSS